MKLTHVISHVSEKGNHINFLHAWDQKWGTSCVIGLKHAMRFDSRQLAEVAAACAALVCRNADGECAGHKFVAHAIYEPEELPPIEGIEVGYLENPELVALAA